MHYWKDSNNSIMQILFENLKTTQQKQHFIVLTQPGRNCPAKSPNYNKTWILQCSGEPACHCLSNAITPVRSNNASVEDNLPVLQYLLGLDRRGTYVVRESVEKVLCIRMIELLPFTCRLLFTTTRVTSQRPPSKFPSRKLRMKCLSTCWATRDQTSSISTDARVSVWAVMSDPYDVVPWLPGRRKSRWLSEPSETGRTPEKQWRNWSLTTTRPAGASVGRAWVSHNNNKDECHLMRILGDRFTCWF